MPAIHKWLLFTVVIIGNLCLQAHSNKLHLSTTLAFLALFVITHGA